MKVHFKKLIPLLKKLEAQAKVAAQDGSQEKQEFVPNKLGYAGILINDPTGEVFSKERTFIIQDRLVRVYDQQTGRIHQFSHEATDLESQLLDESSKTGVIDSQNIEKLRQHRARFN